MAPTTMTQGLCPSCGAAVGRQITVRAGIAEETYMCPRDGERTYGPQAVSVAAWATPTMATIRTLPEVDATLDWA